MSVSAAWVVSLLTALEPSAPWKDTYENTADAIAKVADSASLFPAEERGAEHTASLLVAMAWYESRLKPSAKSKDGRSFCLYQIDRSYLAPDPKKSLEDPELCTRTAVRLVRQSFDLCKSRAPNDRLAFYNSGHCDRGGVESRYRMFLATKLLKDHPPPPPAPPAPPGNVAFGR